MSQQKIELNKKFQNLLEFIKKIGNETNEELYKDFTLPVCEVYAKKPDFVEDYQEMVKIPMDLGIIQKKVKQKGYTNYKRFYEDVNLVWRNCLDYNKSKTPLFKFAKTLQSKFEKEYQKVFEEEISQDLLEEFDALLRHKTYKIEETPRSMESGPLCFMKSINNLSDQVFHSLQDIKKTVQDDLNNENWTKNHWERASEYFEKTIYIKEEKRKKVYKFNNTTNDFKKSILLVVDDFDAKIPYYRVLVHSEFKLDICHNLDKFEAIFKTNTPINSKNQRHQLINAYYEEGKKLIDELRAFKPTVLCCGLRGTGKSWVINKLTTGEENFPLRSEKGGNHVTKYPIVVKFKDINNFEIEVHHKNEEDCNKFLEDAKNWKKSKSFKENSILLVEKSEVTNTLDSLNPKDENSLTLKYVELRGNFNLENFTLIDTPGEDQKAESEWNIFESLIKEFKVDVLMFSSARCIDSLVLEPFLLKMLEHTKLPPVIISTYFDDEDKNDEQETYQGFVKIIKDLEDSNKIIPDNLWDREQYITELKQKCLVFPRNRILKDKDCLNDFLDQIIQNCLSQNMNLLHMKVTSYIALNKALSTIEKKEVNETDKKFEKKFNETVQRLENSVEFNQNPDCHSWLSSNQTNLKLFFKDIIKKIFNLDEILKKDFTDIILKTCKEYYKDFMNNYEKFLEHVNDHYCKLKFKKKQNDKVISQTRDQSIADFKQIIQTFIKNNLQSTNKSFNIYLKDKLIKMLEDELKNLLRNFKKKVNEIKNQKKEENDKKDYNEFIDFFIDKVESLKIWNEVDNELKNSKNETKEKLINNIKECLGFGFEDEINWESLYQDIKKEGDKRNRSIRLSSKDPYKRYLFCENEYLYNEISQNYSNNKKNNFEKLETEIKIEKMDDNIIKVDFIEKEKLLIYKMNKTTNSLIISHKDFTNSLNLRKGKDELMYIPPIFILGYLGESENLKRTIGNFASSEDTQKFEENEKYLQFFLIDKEILDEYKEFIDDKNSKKKFKRNLIFIVLPKKNLKIAVRFDIQKYFIETIGFNYYVNVDQNLTGVAELYLLPYTSGVVTLGRAIRYFKDLYNSHMMNFITSIQSILNDSIVKAFQNEIDHQQNEYIKNNLNIEDLRKKIEENYKKKQEFEEFLYKIKKPNPNIKEFDEFFSFLRDIKATDRLKVLFDFREKFQKIRSVCCIGTMLRKNLFNNVSSVKMRPYQSTQPQYGSKYLKF